MCALQSYYVKNFKGFDFSENTTITAPIFSQVNNSGGKTALIHTLLFLKVNVYLVLSCIADINGEFKDVIYMRKSKYEEIEMGFFV